MHKLTQTWTVALVLLLPAGGAVGRASGPAVPQTQTFAVPQGQIENVTIARDGTKFTVTYDLVSSDPEAVFKIMLEVQTTANGTPFTAVAVSGEVGDSVTPGKGKTISWDSARDTDNQAFDRFRFKVIALEGRPTKIDPTTPPPPPPSTPGSAGAAASGAVAPTAPFTAGDVWRGTYAGFPAQLTVLQANPPAFTGTLLVLGKLGEPATQIAVEGRLAQGAIELRELRVEQPGALRGWRLGSGMGRVTDDKQISGSGNDQRNTYQWNFDRATGTAEITGRWEGEYAGFPAVLLIDRRDGNAIGGRLMVTTKKNGDDTVLDIEGMALAGSIQFKETRLVGLGSAKEWTLGNATGSFEALQARGTGSDGRNNYKWYFVRR